MIALNKFIPKDPLKKWSTWVVLIAIIIAFIFLFRSCSKKEILHKDIYFIGRDSSWYPLKLYGKEKNLIAFTNDLLVVVSKEAGVHFHWVEGSPNTLLENLNNEIYDAIVSSLRPNAVNREYHLFSDLVFETGPVLVVRKDSAIKSLQDMDGLTIGTISGSPVFNAVRESGANDYDLVLAPYNNVNQAMEALVKNQIDGVIIDAIPAYTLAESFYSDQVKVVTAPLNDEGLRLITLITPSAELLIKEFNEILEKLKKDGTYDALISKWELINPEKRFVPHDEAAKNEAQK